MGASDSPHSIAYYVLWIFTGSRHSAVFPFSTPAMAVPARLNSIPSQSVHFEFLVVE
jgi:hypothetical protein